MKTQTLIFLLGFLMLFSCSSDNSKSDVTTYKCTATINKDSKLILSNRTNTVLDTIIFEKQEVLTGEVVKRIAGNAFAGVNPDEIIYTCKISALNKSFKNAGKVDDIFFIFRNLDIVWIGSEAYQSNFYHEDMNATGEAGKSYSLNFREGGKKHLFETTSNNRIIQIVGSIKIDQIK